MIVSREVDYAIRTVRALSSGQLISVGTICELEHIPVQFAYKILKKLEHAGLVESRRGACGGYQLICPASELTLFDVISAIEKELCLNQCMQHNSSCPLNSKDKHCGVYGELCRIQDALFKMLREKPLSEIT